MALVGNSGYSTGAHLHYEVLLNDQPHDPLKYVVDEVQRAQALRGR
ncbi:MAG: M23 family metallopeptidase [Candidatus Methylomirabilales bacterium]